ncbi:FeoA family protein [Anaerovorax sp. IOR16]|uniref:FeoA family protein n=1 Tax=Anaerovorax sp. IOR16 TaxID=2773458 RepID=UPI0019D21E9B|nr:FeoA family protein [Anaerovorax sp. IOR16]MEA4986722.1 FeoA family protein [Anaerovorax sp.]
METKKNIPEHSLDHLPIGKSTVVTDLNAHGIQRHRMMDLGLIKGAPIEALHKSPCGDPTAYNIMGAVIALRKEDAKKIIIKDVFER